MRTPKGAHSQSCRETVDMSPDTFRTKCFRSAMRLRIAFSITENLKQYRASQTSAWRHRSDFLPILQNPSASRRRLELCRTRTTGRTEASALVSRIGNLINPPAYLTSIRSTVCNRVHLFGCGIRIDSEVSSGMRPNAAGLRESERIVISDENRVSRHTCGHGLSVHHSASQLPGSRQQLVFSLRGGRFCGCTAERVICAAGDNCRRDTNKKD